MGKSPAMPPPIWKNPIDAVAAVAWYQAARSTMYSIPERIVNAFTSPRITEAANMFQAAWDFTVNAVSNIAAFFNSLIKG